MNEHLIKLFEYTLPYHIAFFWALLGLCAVYLCLTQLNLSDKNYVLKIRYYLPIYHAVLACSVMTGLVLMSAFNFELNLKNAKMIVAVFALIALSAIGYKRLKRYALIKELDKFRVFALKKSVADIVIIVMAGI
ncbi:hypothetical protein KDE13_03770 [Campylobacter sp. faydin G-140]|uniref:hypothetical protein n=1 Tax=Campylobacter anatolicus TaxID=2829105 RepID=UPI001B8F3D93|nr:hypothetical protein [Campylobacter anatolicus]MBR8465478.1 hypothetical protein [Campylobacter anatolicus]